MMLAGVATWSPFRIDALGLVTMLGTEEVDSAVGRLIENPWVEYLPMLGAFVLAGNRFTQPKSGNVLYNISDGIMATDVAGWLSRWLAAQDLAWNTTTCVWSVSQNPRSSLRNRLPALMIGCLLNSGLVALSVLVNDWFGFANALSMVTSVFVRSYLVQQNQASLDRKACSLQGRDRDPVKTFCLLADGKAVTLLAPRGMVTKCFLTTPQPESPRLYSIVRYLGWMAFTCHIICIGQSTLFMQILTVVLMVVATVVQVRGIDCDELQLGRHISIYRKNQCPGKDTRTIAYTRLELSSDEEATMLSWSLFPQLSNQRWWDHYKGLKATRGKSSTAKSHEGDNKPTQAV